MIGVYLPDWLTKKVTAQANKLGISRTLYIRLVLQDIMRKAEDEGWIPELKPRDHE